MFGLGLIKGTIFGVTLGLMTGVIIKKICKKNKSPKPINEEVTEK